MPNYSPLNPHSSPRGAFIILCAATLSIQMWLYINDISQMVVN
jgi:hypothetical protein